MEEWEGRSYRSCSIGFGSPSDLNHYLSLYVLETRNKKGGKYPTSTMNLLLAGIKRHMVSVNPNAPNILDESNPSFAGLRGVRDCVAKELYWYCSEACYNDQLR